MQIGKIVDLPGDYSSYARVRDENNNEYTVHGSEIPADSREGEDFAYYVDVWQNKSGNTTTLHSNIY